MHLINKIYSFGRGEGGRGEEGEREGERERGRERDRGRERGRPSEQERRGGGIYGIDIMANILIYPVDWLVFWDETGCNNKDGFHKQGYSFVGESPISFNFLSHGTRISAIYSCTLPR